MIGKPEKDLKCRGGSGRTEREWEDTVALATRCGVTAMRLLPNMMIDVELIGSMPHDLLTQHCMLPLERDGFELTLAMADPLDVIGEDTVHDGGAAQAGAKRGAEPAQDSGMDISESRKPQDGRKQSRATGLAPASAIAFVTPRSSP